MGIVGVRGGLAAVRRRPLLTAAGTAVVAAAIAVPLALGVSSGTVGPSAPAGADRVLSSVPTARPQVFGRPHDQISAAEWGYARQLATHDNSVPADATDVNGRPGPEVLAVDVAPGVTTGRVLQVMLYDYTSDRLLVQTVDLIAGTVSSGSAQGVQPPVDDAEARVAIRILLASPLGDGLKADYLQATGSVLTDVAQLGYQAGSYTADPGDSGAERCGTDRCAELHISDPSGSYFDTSGVVIDLSTKSALAVK